MRIGSTILLADQKCIQSYNWSLQRRLGSLQHVVDSLEEYQCDEIAIIRPIRRDNSLDLFAKDITSLKALKSMTPISFGGGIRSVKYLEQISDLPVERLIFSSAFIAQDIELLEYAKSLYGKQAIQCLLPIFESGEGIKVYLPSKNRSINLTELNIDVINEYANEIILFDMSNEGVSDQFNLKLLDKVSFSKPKLILSGGIGANVIRKAKALGIAAVLIDNQVLHKEFSIRGYRNA